MSTVINHVPLGLARAGMIAGANVLDRDGRVLLQRGAVLDGANLRALRERGITLLPMASSGAEAPPECGDIGARIDHLFGRCAGDFLMQELRRAVLEYRAGRRS